MPVRALSVYEAFTRGDRYGLFSLISQWATIERGRKSVRKFKKPVHLEAKMPQH